MPLQRYVAAWNAGDLDAWLAVHHEDVEYVSLAGDDPRVFKGHEGLREVWAESRANWVRFTFAVLAEDGGSSQVGYSGLDTVGGPEMTGVLWFHAESRDGRILRLWSAFDRDLLPPG